MSKFKTNPKLLKLAENKKWLKKQLNVASSDLKKKKIQKPGEKFSDEEKQIKKLKKQIAQLSIMDVPKKIPIT